MAEEATFAGPVRRGSRILSASWKVILGDPGTAVSAVLIAVTVIAAIFAPLLAPYNPIAQDVTYALQAPGWNHLLGTDDYGRDVLSRVIFGARPALVIGLSSVAVAVLLGAPLGLIAGFRGGWFDTAISGVVDVLLSFPTLLLAIMVVTLAGSGVTVVIIAIGFAQLPIYVRLARGSALVIRELDYVAASRTFGAGQFRILRKHILPNALGPLIVMATLGIAGAIREEAGLSFLGLGIQPPNPSWGNLIRDGVNNILDAPWMALAPGLLLTINVFAFNLMGDTIRDVLDPRNISNDTSERGGER